MTQPTRVLVVDDSRFAQRWIVRALENDPSFQVVGVADNGAEGLTRAMDLRPDVITLDVEMPVRDGLSMLRGLMETLPMPVVMVSSRTTRSATITVDALALGAIDFVTKPSADPLDQERAAAELRERVRTASRASVGRVGQGPESGRSVPGAPVSESRPESRPAPALVVLCSSTGGPAALRTVVPRLSMGLGAGVVIVQHMPAGFTAALATRLDELSAIPVREAADRDRVQADEVVVAPGDRHLAVGRDGTTLLSQLPRVNGVRPSADVTLQSAAAAWGDRLLAVVMTGIGVDGLEGVRATRLSGGRVICQDAATSLVHGMPRAVEEAGLADDVLPLDAIPGAIERWSRRQRAVDGGR